MPMRAAIAANGIFGPDEIDLLGRVFARARHFAGTPQQEEALALEIIEIFRSGVTDEEAILEMLGRSRRTGAAYIGAP
ncbi:hypothetical protein [Nitratireductor sp. ZSWI3]|uniref:hypothetical protein n=1 Tax=Nitratireductor sp. ZSWI3 TaxID=2966359 RepID=UPI00214FD2A6|nr:hypothetical protein [Nitratireductor sp. ZSWI3]MCR4266739.1 hypothetical protein [Nitratireductor sp. ZSWI3]